MFFSRTRFIGAFKGFRRPTQSSERQQQQPQAIDDDEEEIQNIIDV